MINKLNKLQSYILQMSLGNQSIVVFTYAVKAVYVDN